MPTTTPAGRMEKAVGALEDAKKTVGALWTECLALNRMEEMDLYAGVARGLSRLSEGLLPDAEPDGIEVKIEDAAGGTGPTQSRLTAKAPPRRGKSPRKSIRFKRQGDRLVKIGWSKKARSEYEHRATHDAVIAFVDRLRAKVKPDTTFKVEDLGSIEDKNGHQVPSYQVYLVLLWLQYVDVVEKQGRDGYRYVERGLSEDSIHRKWESLSPE